MILTLLFISAVNASDVDDVEIAICDNISACQVPGVPDEPDVPDLVVNETIYISSKNIDQYFKDNTLSNAYDNKTFIFEDDFENLNKLTIKASNITIKGENAVLKNTVFDISSDGVSLTNLCFELDTSFNDNDGAAILFTGNNLVFDNLEINYDVPLNSEAYALYGVGLNSKNFKLINSKINFKGNNRNGLIYNCAVKLLDYDDSLMANNQISTSLPLKDVNFGAEGAQLDSDYVLSVGVEDSNGFQFINNTILSEVNYRADTQYPTLDAFMISRCVDSNILYNSIYMVDFITNPGVDNYLYGIDIYNLENLTVAHNTVSIITSGGKMSAGTAYPIQITGPISKVNITENDLYSFSNGPNIGIYSQNYYGSTDLSITKNRINVTGLAGSHEWALVSGIETQDTNSLISDNIIEVHSVVPVNVNDNIYGVSYSQSTSGNHKYNIQNNTVFSDGFKSVYLMSSKDSSVGDNLLVSFNENARNGYDGFEYLNLNNHRNINFENNKVIRAFDYFAGLNNNVESGDGHSYTSPENKNHITNDIDYNSFKPNSNQNSHTNPLISGDSDYQAYVLVLYDITNDYSSDENGDDGNDFKDNDDDLKDDDGGSSVLSNSSDVTPSIGGSTPLGDFGSSGSSSSSVSKKAYEINELTKNTSFVPSIFYVILALILFIIGYKTRKSQMS